MGNNQAREALCARCNNMSAQACPRRSFCCSCDSDENGNRPFNAPYMRRASSEGTERSLRPYPTETPSVQMITGYFVMSERDRSEGHRFVMIEYDPKAVEEASSVHDNQCRICFDNTIDIALHPCQHTMCHSCWNKIDQKPGRCPWCRLWISTIRTKSRSITPFPTGIHFATSRCAPSRTHSRRAPHHEVSDEESSDVNEEPANPYLLTSRTYSRRPQAGVSDQEETPDRNDDENSGGESFPEELAIYPRRSQENNLEDKDSTEEESFLSEDLEFVQEKRPSELNLRRLSSWFVKTKPQNQLRGA